MTDRRLRMPDCRRIAALAVGVSTLLPGPADSAPLDDIRLSRIGDVTTTEIELGCAMRYLDHTPADGGIELEVHMALGYGCRIALIGTLNVLRRPRGGRMAHLQEIEFDAISDDRASLTLRFERPVAFEVRQTSNEYMLTVIVDTARSMPSARPEAPAASIPAVPPQPQVSGDRAPGRRVERPEPLHRDRFVVRLAAVAAIDDADRRALERHLGDIAYTETVTVAGKTWTELRLGFFDSEAAALAVLAELKHRFPDAWVTVATQAEQRRASARRLSFDDLLPEDASPPPAATAAAVEPRPPMPEQRIAALMAEAKAALLRADYDESIRIYTRLLDEPSGQHRREAREFLGVARQKNGQIAHAKSEFEAYLEEFPDGPEAQRVRQRLAALAESVTRPAVAARIAEPPGRSAERWQYSGGVSQFYLHGVNLSRADEADVVTQSALLSQAVLAADRRGTRFDVSVRANGGYLHDFADGGAEHQAMASYLYLDISDTQLNWSARMGRQMQHRAGVLGRFDGANLRYRLRPDLSVNVTAGFPVDSPRYLAQPDRYFYGASIELDNVADVFDFSAFSNLQMIDGIWDRQAFGAEAQYHGERLNLVGLIDYDASYNVLNTAMVTGNLRLFDRLTVHGRFRRGANPFLTTRNAIIGQPAHTVETLLETYSEGQVRRLARNRTAEAVSGSGGISAELSQRLHLNFDVSYVEYGSTIASGGVAAIPRATGPQILYRGDLVGSSLLKQGDLLILGYRRFESRRVDSDTLILDLRYPFGQGLRINPRIGVTVQHRDRGVEGAIRHLVAHPMLRVLYRGRRHYRIEFELGGQWSDQELPPDQISPFAPDGTIRSSSYYAHLGYWLDFR